MIRETLRNLPEGLGETYRRILIKISESPSKAKLAQKVFKWATVAKRPLNVEELKEAVAIEPGDKSWDEAKFPHEDLMFESCRGLIIKDEDDGTAHFAHHTVRQYLTGGLTTKVDPLFEISVADADLLAGQACVAYLTFSDFETQITSTTPIVRLEQKGILESGGPLWIPSVLGIRRSMFNIPFRLLRGDPAVRPSDSDYWKYLRPKPKSKINPSTDLKEKYRLLCYAIEHWELHTRWSQSSDSGFRSRLKSLVKHKILAFDFRPWGSNQHFGPYGCVGCPSPSAESLVAKDLPYLSMIHYAAEVGNLPFLTSHYFTEIEIGEYIYHERYHNETLLIACRHNRTEIVKYLIEQERYDISDGRAITTAAAAGHVDVLQYLLSLGQYSAQQQGHIALSLAAKNGHEAVVEVLAVAGADLDAYDKQTGRSVVDLAAMNGHDSVIRTLMQRGAQKSTGQGGLTALHLAATNGHAAATRVLLESGFPEDKADSSGRTALHLAAKSGHSAVTEVLLENGANPSLEALATVPSGDRSGGMPFHLAAQGGHVKVLELFMQHVPSVDFPRTISEKTALHSAVAGGQEKAIRWLIKNGADVNAMDLVGDTPLNCAANLGDMTAVRVLLEHGAMEGLYSRSPCLIMDSQRSIASELFTGSRHQEL